MAEKENSREKWQIFKKIFNIFFNKFRLNWETRLSQMGGGVIYLFRKNV